MTPRDPQLQDWMRWFYGGTPPVGDVADGPLPPPADGLLDEPVLERVVGEIAVGSQLELFHHA